MVDVAHTITNVVGILRGLVWLAVLGLALLIGQAVMDQLKRL